MLHGKNPDQEVKDSFRSWGENLYKQAFITQGLKLTEKIKYEFTK